MRMAKEVKPPKVKIEQNPEEPVEKKVLAAALLAMSRGVESLLGSGLRLDDLVVLIARRAPSVGKPDIRAVIQALNELRHEYSK